MDQYPRVNELRLAILRVTKKRMRKKSGVEKRKAGERRKDGVRKEQGHHL